MKLGLPLRLLVLRLHLLLELLLLPLAGLPLALRQPLLLVLLQGPQHQHLRAAAKELSLPQEDLHTPLASVITATTFGQELSRAPFWSSPSFAFFAASQAQRLIAALFCRSLNRNPT